LGFLLAIALFAYGKGFMVNLLISTAYERFPFPSSIGFLHLVRAVSISIERAARLYGVDPRTVRPWC